MNPFDAALLGRARDILRACTERRLTLSILESCTGGLVTALLTEVPGSSAVVERGLVVYSNAAKTELLGVPVDLIAREGAVSASVAEAMCRGALQRFPVDLALSITGIAGPGGGSPAKPVGLVFIGSGRRDGTIHVERHLFAGDRAAIRAAAVRGALDALALQLAS